VCSFINRRSTSAQQSRNVRAGRITGIAAPSVVTSIGSKWRVS
jgi:hypothetical protein